MKWNFKMVVLIEEWSQRRGFTEHVSSLSSWNQTGKIVHLSLSKVCVSHHQT